MTGAHGSPPRAAAEGREADPAKRVLRQVQMHFGMVPTLYRHMASAPAVVEATLALERAGQGALAPRLRELAAVRVSQLNGCSACEHYHRRLGRAAGLTELQFNELPQFESSSTLGELERAVLRFTEQWTGPGKVDEGVRQLLATELTPAQVVELAATVGLLNWTTRFSVNFGRVGPS